MNYGNPALLPATRTPMNYGTPATAQDDVNVYDGESVRGHLSRDVLIWLLVAGFYATMAYYARRVRAGPRAEERAQWARLLGSTLWTGLLDRPRPCFGHGPELRHSLGQTPYVVTRCPKSLTQILKVDI